MHGRKRDPKVIAKIMLLLMFQAVVSPVGTAHAEPAFTNVIAREAYGYFCQLLTIPRGSGNEQAISDYLVAFAEQNHLDVVQDEWLNVLIRKPGTKGRENEPPVILQAHMDMVCEKNEGVGHDFLNDPIVPIVDGDWLRADGTTLGADDAGGVSLIMAVLAARDLSHPPIEAVITTAEETNMGGAAHFDVTLLKGKRLINLDSEEEGAFTVSCASTNNIFIVMPIEYEIAREGFVTYELTVKGLMGGHSGVDIGKGRANANILAARLINMLDDGAISVASINGGSAKNAIPRECTVALSFAEADLETIKTKIAQAEAAFRTEYPFDTSLTVTLVETVPLQSMMSHASLRRVVAGLELMPNGVQAMSHDIEGLVRTSNNPGIIVTDASTVTLTNYLRSSLISEQDFVIDKMTQLASVLCAEATVIKQAPPWEYRANSPLRDTMAMVFEEIYGKAPAVAAIHAGLECALFAGKMPDCDLISIGMDIRGAHSPDERMSISSYDRTCGYLAALLEAL